MLDKQINQRVKTDSNDSSVFTEHDSHRNALLLYVLVRVTVSVFASVDVQALSSHFNLICPQNSDSICSIAFEFLQPDKYPSPLQEEQRLPVVDPPL